jgi:glucose/arabinose dehydrogenase
MKLLFICLTNLFLFPAVAALEYQQQLIRIEGTSRQVTVPKGYQLELLTASLEAPRMLTFAKVQGVEDLISGFQLDNGDRWARPVGVAFGPDGALYFSSESGVNALFRLAPDPDFASH